MRIPSFALIAVVALSACGSEAVTETSIDDAATGSDTTSTGGDGAATTDTRTTADGTSGGDTNTTPTDTATGVSDTTSPPGDSAGGINCGNKTCTGGQVCCVTTTGGGATSECAASCADGGIAITCDGPEDCTGGKICCATVELTGTLLACTFKQGSAECKGACASMVPFSCTGTATVRPCHAAADCTEASYNKCCTFERNGTVAQFCAPQQAQAAAKSCL